MESVQKSGAAIIATPVWVLVFRIFQIIFSLIIVALAGWFIHGLYSDALGFAIVCSLFTWVIALYTILSEKVVGCHKAYNTWAHLSLDGLMIIFWLSCMGAVAAYRGGFKYDVNASCYSDGSAVNSGHCVISKREQAGVAGKGALNMVSGIAGLSALNMLLFAATFGYVCHFFRKAHFKSSSDPEKGSTTQAGTEMTSGAAHPHNVQYPQAQSQPLMNQYQGQPQQQGYPQQYQQEPPQYGQGYPQQAVYDQHAYQQPVYQGAGQQTAHMPDQLGQGQPGQVPNHQQPYSPYGTPAPGQPHQHPTHHQ